MAPKLHISLTRTPDWDNLPAALVERYEPRGHELLGEGAFAVVGVLRDRSTDELCACKVVEKYPMRIRNLILQMEREVRIQSSLRHPNILRLLAGFEDATYVYMVLEYCGRGQLRAILQQQPERRFEEPVAGGYFGQIVQGVEWMHRHSCVHRDLKLENMLLTEIGGVKICDFGWSAELEIEKLLKTLCGTTMYWAPELFKNEPQNESVDMWALGCLCYEMLSSHAPFFGGEQVELMNKVLAVQFTYPPWFSKEACHIIHCVLQRNPDHRVRCVGLLDHAWLKKHYEPSPLLPGSGVDATQVIEGDPKSAAGRAADEALPLPGERLTSVGNPALSSVFEGYVPSPHEVIRSVGPTAPPAPKQQQYPAVTIAIPGGQGPVGGVLVGQLSPTRVNQLPQSRSRSAGQLPRFDATGSSAPVVIQRRAAAAYASTSTLSNPHTAAVDQGLAPAPFHTGFSPIHRAVVSPMRGLEGPASIATLCGPLGADPFGLLVDSEKEGSLSSRLAEAPAPAPAAPPPLNLSSNVVLPASHGSSISTAMPSSTPAALVGGSFSLQPRRMIMRESSQPTVPSKPGELYKAAEVRFARLRDQQQFSGSAAAPGAQAPPPSTTWQVKTQAAVRPVGGSSLIVQAASQHPHVLGTTLAAPPPRQRIASAPHGVYDAGGGASGNSMRFVAPAVAHGTPGSVGSGGSISLLPSRNHVAIPATITTAQPPPGAPGSYSVGRPMGSMGAVIPAYGLVNRDTPRSVLHMPIYR